MSEYQQDLVLFEALKYERPWTLAGYRQFGGYQAWEKILREQTPREKIIDEVKASGEEQALEPMSPADRKVVHDTVNEIDGVETRSDGTEPSRYVVIKPSS